MQSNNWFRYIMLLLCVTAILGGRMIQPRLARMRNTYALVSRPSSEGVPPEYILASAALGGFRGLFLTTLWVRAQNMKNDGMFYEMVDIYNIITKLEPNFHNAWAFQAWDLAYNVSVEHNNGEDRVFWVFRGVDMLRKQGIPKNPRIPELCNELAWFFHHKIGQETDWANPLYRAYLFRQVERAFQIKRGRDKPLDGDTQTAYLAEMSALPEERGKLFEDPEFSRIAGELKALGFDIFKDGKALFSRHDRPAGAGKVMAEEYARDMVRRARLWVIAGNIRRELGMDPRRMYRLADRFGPIDWRTPFAHALYWSSQAYQVWQESNPREPSLKFERLMRSSLISLVYQGRIFETEDGYPYYVPDFRLFDGVVKHIEATLEYFKKFKRKDGSTLPMTGFKSGYHNFLQDAVFKLYFDGRKRHATRILNKLAKITDNERFKMSLELFIKKNFAEWIDSPSWKDSLIFMQSTLATGYFYLAVGDIKAYEYQSALADYFYRKYCIRRWNPRRANPNDPDYRHTVPPMDEIKKGVLMAIVSGYDPRFRRRIIQRNLQVRVRGREPAVWNAVEFEIRKMMKRQQQAQ